MIQRCMWCKEKSEVYGSIILVIGERTLGNLRLCKYHWNIIDNGIKLAIASENTLNKRGESLGKK